MNLNGIENLCDDIERKNRLILSYAKRIEKLNEVLDNLVILEKEGKLDEFLKLEDILRDTLESADYSKRAVGDTLERMEYFEREIDYFINK